MPRQMWPAVVGLGIFALAAIAIAAYTVATGVLDPALVAACTLLLAAGQFGLIFASSLTASRLEGGISNQYRNLNQLSQTVDSVSTRLSLLEQQDSNPSGGRLDEIMADVRALRDGFKSLITPKTPSAVEQPASPAPVSRSSDEHLELLLEPVIELATGSTAHYRALLDLTDDHGHVVRHADLMHKADAGGMRPALDAHMVKLVAPVLRRLRNRNPGLRAFLPIGAATLESAPETARILAALERDVDIASGLIFEFQHRDLGGLDVIGIENLAKLGRLGATLALSDVQVSGLDLAALRQLGVRYLSFAPGAADAGFGPTPAWREFVQYARAMKFQVIMSDISTTQQATAAAQIARYGFGPFFAPPRKVRADAGVAAGLRRAQAA